jgi:hypothetical protein
MKLFDKIKGWFKREKTVDDYIEELADVKVDYEKAKTKWLKNAANGHIDIKAFEKNDERFAKRYVEVATEAMQANSDDVSDPSLGAEKVQNIIQKRLGIDTEEGLNKFSEIRAKYAHMINHNLELKYKDMVPVLSSKELETPVKASRAMLDKYGGMCVADEHAATDATKLIRGVLKDCKKHGEKPILLLECPKDFPIERWSEKDFQMVHSWAQLYHITVDDAKASLKERRLMLEEAKAMGADIVKFDKQDASQASDLGDLRTRLATTNLTWPEVIKGHLKEIDPDGTRPKILYSGCDHLIKDRGITAGNDRGFVDEAMGWPTIGFVDMAGHKPKLGNQYVDAYDVMIPTQSENIKMIENRFAKINETAAVSPTDIKNAQQSPREK